MPSKNKQEWKGSTFASALSKKPERQKSFETGDGITLEPVYSPEDMGSFDYAGFPGLSR